MPEPENPKPNIHYIGVIEESDSRVVFKKYQIELPHALLDAMDAILKDNENGSLLALQAEMTRHYSEDERQLFCADYLAPRHYDDAYVSSTRFPRIWTEAEYHAEEEKARAETTEAYEKEVKERLERNLTPPMEKLEDRIRERLKQHRIQLRNLYYSVALRFICSHSYRAAWASGRLNQRPEVKMFTTDNIGWTKYIYSINKDINIRLDSNFGFGRASYFQLGVSYKGIEIFPYSSYVRYYYANWRTLLRHTRSYEVERRSWDYALEFVEKHANLAMEDPDKFVNEFIIGEVKNMTDGLVDIMSMTQERFAEEMNPNNAKRPRYLGVSIPTKRDVKRYAVYPREMLMAYKAVKITGALAFLGNIKALSGTLSQVSQYFEKIISLVNQELPKIRGNIASIAEDVKKLESEKAPLVKELEPLVKELANMDGEISGLQSNSDEEHKEAKETPFERSKRHQGIRESYILAHPLYKQFSDRISALKSEIRRIDEDIRGRLEFSKRLTACKSVAEKAGEFKAILNAMRPHEEAIARKTEEELTKRDLSKMKPAEIDGVKAMAHFSYTNEHMDFDGLTKRRDEILGEIDSFRLV